MSLKPIDVVNIYRAAAINLVQIVNVIQQMTNIGQFFMKSYAKGAQNHLMNNFLQKNLKQFRQFYSNNYQKNHLFDPFQSNWNGNLANNHILVVEV